MVTKPSEKLKLLSNNPEGLQGIEKELHEIKQQAKKEVFDTLTMDKHNFLNISEETKKIKDFLEDTSKTEIIINKNIISRDRFNQNPKYGGMLNSLNESVRQASPVQKERVYMEIAERVILDNKKVITYKDGEEIGGNIINEEYVKNQYDILNDQYDGKLDYFSWRDHNNTLYIIKWSHDQLEDIEKRENELLGEKVKDLMQNGNEDKIKTLKSLLNDDSDDNNRLSNSIDEEDNDKAPRGEGKKTTKKGGGEGEGEEGNEGDDEAPRGEGKKTTKKGGGEGEGEEGEEDNDKAPRGEGKKTTKKGGGEGEGEEGNEGDDEAPRGEGKKTTKKENGKNNNESTESNEKEKEEFLRRLKEYCPWLFEGQDKGKDKKENKKEDSEMTESSRESMEKNPLYVSRKDVAQSVFASRRTSEYPVGKVEIKGTYVNIEEFEFYEEIKQEYILARGDTIKLAELDKKLAELIILCSPRGVDVEQRYEIRLTEEEIIAGGLVVSQDFLARYGIAIDYFEYTSTIIEREYRERIETVKKIEIEINELTKIITELTRKINIEKYSSEKILEEIRVKKERVRILKEKLYALLISLRKSGNGGKEGIDADLLALKDREKNLMEELEQLKEKKKHQEDVNNRIKELKEKMRDHESWNKLRGLMAEKASAKSTLNRLESEEADLAKAEKEAEKALEPLASDMAPEEINRLTNEYYEIQKRRTEKQKEIEALKNRLAEIDKEIENNPSYKKWQELSDILDSMANEQTISIITHDGKRCVLSKKGDYYDKKFNPTKLFDGKNPNKDELLMALDTDEIQKIIIGESSNNPQEILLGDDPKLKEELARLEDEQAGFDKDIDQKILDKEKELADIREQIKNKESKRIVLAEFDDGDNGANFYDYCEKNGIKRKDGKDIPLTGGLDTSAIYVDKDGRELKLEPTEMSNGDGYDKPIARYELVYYEKSESTGTSEIEQELLLIIQEQEELYMELEELEHKLTIEKSESIKLEIEEQIRIIQEKLTTINKRITEITNITKIYKETLIQRKYAVIRVRKIPVYIPPVRPFEMDAVISDMGTDVFREKASLKVEEELKAYYKSLGRWQVGSRLALFLGRGRRRKRMIRNEMNGMANTAFQRGAGYATLNDQSQNAADRHKHELDNNMEAINQIARVHNQQVDQLCRDYLNNRVTDDQFQDQFNQIIANDANIQNILNGQSITHIGTNILLRLQEQKAFNQLILTMDAQLAHYIATGNQVYMDNMRNFVSQYIKDYQKTPAFMANFEQFVNGNLNARNQLRLYLNHQKQVMQMQITNLRMNIDILNRGKSAYQIDNTDRETGKGSWKFKLGHFMDKHPRGTAIASTAISVGIGLGTGLIASPVLAGAVSLGLFGGLVGTTNAVKKWTHHTKEQNTHEKNVATDYRNEQAKIQAWQNQALNGHGWRKYKAKRQLALYDQTTQENIRLSDQITEYITNLSSKVGPLTADEDNFMRCNLIEGWARLKYYRQMGHNFLASEQVDSTEKDMKRLEKAITLGLQKIGRTTNDIEHNMNATNQLGTNITYAVIQNDLKASYDKSLIQFKRERRMLSMKYGFGTAIASIGVGLGMQYLTGTGVFGKSTIECPEAEITAVKDNFALGSAELTNGSNNVYSDTKSALSSVSQSGSHLNLEYGAGTDATHVIPGRLKLSELIGSGGKISTAEGNIDALVGTNGFTQAHADVFKDALHHLPTGSGTNGVLQNMRQVEGIEEWARALADSGKSSLISPSDIMISHNPALDVIGTTNHTLADRVFNGVVDVAGPCIEHEAPKRGRWFMGFPLFFNTFKDRKATKDTTDQNFGRGNNQQPNRPNNQQPNRPQVNPNRPNNP